MRRRVIGVMVFLLLGAITNVLVALGCAYWGTWMNLVDGGWGYHHLGTTSWGFAKDVRVGFERVQLMQGYEFPSHITVIPGTDTTLPAWVVPVRSPNPETRWSMHVAAGWPLVSMGCQTKLMDAQDEVAYRMDDAWQNAIRIPVQDPLIVDKPLPMRPIWRNAILNSLIFAAAWWALFMAFKLLRAAYRRVVVYPTSGIGNPICPRCGYDQRGVITQWTDVCPLRGICSECGLHFDWCELLNPQINLPVWSIERPLAAWRFPLQIIGTCLRTLWPWKVWRQIRMSHEVNRFRLIAFVVMLVVSVDLVFSLSHGWLAYQEWNQQVSRVGGGYTASTTGWPVFVQAALLPWSDQPRGTFTSAGGGWAGTGTTFPYTTPRRHFVNTWELLGPPFLWAIAVQVCCGAAFLALPVSRRKAKVRWRHMLRLTIYGGGLIVIPITLMIAAVVVQATRVPGFGVVVFAAELSGILFIPYLIVWWSVGTSRYLRMPHGWAVGVAVVIIGVMLPLVPFAIGSLLSGPF